jgi:Mg-chelatase subunit ChlD
MDTTDDKNITVLDAQQPEDAQTQPVEDSTTATTAPTAASTAASTAQDGISVTPLTLFPTYTTSLVEKTTACLHMVAPAANADDETSRSNLDLCAVIDVSGSMSGSKLNLAKEALLFILKNLKATDRFSLVSYGSDVVTEFGLTTMDSVGKANAERIINRLDTRGCTNLSGGLFEGIRHMQTRTDANPVGSIMLMTDGLANEGIRDVQPLCRATKELMGDNPGYSIYTFGYGSDHNSDMLKNISEVGNGMYYFVETNDMIPESFAHCLGGLLTVQAQNIKLTITVASGAKLIKVETEASVRQVDENTVELNLPDLQAEEQRDVLFHLKLEKTVDDANQIIAKAKLNYMDVPTTSFKDCECTFTVARAEVVGDQTPNEIVQGQIHRLETAETMRRAIEEAERGRFEAAQAMIQHASSNIRSRDAYSVGLQGDLEAASRVMSKSMWKKKGLHEVRSKVQSHSRQRENVTQVTSGYSAYTSSSKAAYYQRAKKGYAPKPSAPKPKPPSIPTPQQQQQQQQQIVLPPPDIQANANIANIANIPNIPSPPFFQPQDAVQQQQQQQIPQMQQAPPDQAQQQAQ